MGRPRKGVCVWGGCPEMSARDEGPNLESLSGPQGERSEG